MQPNEQPGFDSPDQGQVPVQPTAPQPVMPQTVQPVQPVAPVVIGGSVPPPLAQDTVVQSVPAQSLPVQEEAVQPADQFTDESFTDEEYDEDDDEIEPLDQPVSWSAQEYIHQEKGAGWFVLFSLVTLGLIGMSVLMQAWSFTALIVVIVVIVVVYLRRPPRELAYSLTDDGLFVDNKLHKYENFKSFGVIEDRDEYSVMLIPVQRFQPGLTIYFPEEVGEDIVDVLGERLPMKDLKLDAVDRLVRMLRL